MTTSDNRYYVHPPIKKRKIAYPLEYDSYDSNKKYHEDENDNYDNYSNNYDLDETTTTTERYETFNSHYYTPKEKVLKYIIAMAFFLRTFTYIRKVIILETFQLLLSLCY